MAEPAVDRDDVKLLFEVLFDMKALLAQIVDSSKVVMTMAKKRKKLTNREFWEKYGPRFEETDRKLLERIAYHERKIAEGKAARGEDAA